ncbi:MAG TPA: hypothetical protein VGI83_06880 [Gemmatimonadales bacterium]
MIRTGVVFDYSGVTAGVRGAQAEFQKIVTSQKEMDAAFKTISNDLKLAAADFKAGTLSAQGYAQALATAKTQAMALRSSGIEPAGASLTTFAQAMQAGTTATTGHTFATSRFTNQLGSMLARAEGIPGAFGRAAASIGQMVVGGGPLAIALGTVAGLVAVWDAATASAREHAKAVKEAGERYKDLPSKLLDQTNLSEEASDLQTQLDAARRGTTSVDFKTGRRTTTVDQGRVNALSQQLATQVRARDKAEAERIGHLPPSPAMPALGHFPNISLPELPALSINPDAKLQPALDHLTGEKRDSEAALRESQDRLNGKAGQTLAEYERGARERGAAEDAQEKDRLRKIQEANAAAAKQVQDVWRGALESVGQGLDRTFGEAMTGKLKSFKDFMTQIAETIINAGLALGTRAGERALFPGLFAEVHHAGGIVGSGGPSRHVPAFAFQGAPRFHSGLAADEFPAILQKGEQVIPKGGGGSTMHVVTNFNVTAVDDRGVAGFFRDNGAALANEQAKQFRRSRALQKALR